jgi:hypothetical protein
MLHVAWNARRVRVIISRPIRPSGRVWRGLTIIFGFPRSLGEKFPRLISVEAVEESC